VKWSAYRHLSAKTVSRSARMVLTKPELRSFLGRLTELALAAERLSGILRSTHSRWNGWASKRQISEASVLIV